MQYAYHVCSKLFVFWRWYVGGGPLSDTVMPQICQGAFESFNIKAYTMLNHMHQQWFNMVREPTIITSHVRHVHFRDEEPCHEVDVNKFVQPTEISSSVPDVPRVLHIQSGWNGHTGVPWPVSQKDGMPRLDFARTMQCELRLRLSRTGELTQRNGETTRDTKTQTDALFF